MSAIAQLETAHPSAADIDDIMLRLSMVRGLDEIMDVVRRGARSIAGADGITFVLREGDLCYYADEYAISPLWKGQRFPLQACISGWAMLNKVPAVIEDIYADNRIPHAFYRPTFVKSLVMVPVRSEDPVAAIGAYWGSQQTPSEETVKKLQRIANGAAVAMTNVSLLNSLVAAKEEAVRAKDAIIMAMASLAETRDNETGNHLRRTQHYVRVLAEASRVKGLYTEVLSDTMIELLFKSAPLHDIGKVGIPDRILLKPGKLEAQEFEVMKGHADLGRRAILAAERQLGPSSFLNLAKEIAYTHHERWDGSGYPQGLKGSQIPLAGRLMAVADVYDALVSERIYKQAIPHDDAVGIILAERGRHFDPELTDVFATIAPSFAAIARKFADNASTLA